ncbi:MAG: proton-conducting transporter membrane subunit [Oscillospiraceae bacterium]
MPWQRAFVEGGVVSGDVGEIGAVLNLLVILAVVGFGCKSGMFPLHSWLPTAHPQAPAPASSVLSGLITKAGILAIIRIVYFTVGADILVGSIAQKVLLSLSIITIFMGSMLAYKERVLKKRLAYSTVSQVSYIIFGIMLLNTVGVTGALLQVIFHALAKNVLFLCAGAIIYKTHKTNCDDLYGLGRAMPKTFACVTIAGMSLVGIPLTAGFVSKWHLVQGALLSSVKPLPIIGVFVLMISALLTAGYLLTISIRAFFPVTKTERVESCEANNFMTVPLIILTLGIVFFGVFPTPLVGFVQKLAQSLTI